MSPKSNRSGVSYDDSDPRHHSLNPAAVPVQGPRVTRAQDMDAAVEGLPTTEDLERARGDRDEGQEPGSDREEIEERPRPDYGGWTKVQLNEELDRRGIEHDPKANNAVLIEELERSDGGETLSGVND